MNIKMKFQSIIEYWTMKGFVYYLLNKPKGVISATEDANHQTVLVVR